MKFLILLATGFMGFAALAEQGETPRTQCDSVAAMSARLFMLDELRKDGFHPEYPGPEWNSFRVVRPEQEYLVSLGAPRPATIRVFTAQKSYYCAVMGIARE